jgi:metallo-beta-lactamase class B
VSSGGFRFSDDATRVATFERSIARISTLDCALLVSTHPRMSGLFERWEASAGDPGAFVDDAACQRYAESSATRPQRRLQQEQAALATGVRGE